MRCIEVANEPSDQWACLGCGCTNEQACPGGCHWVGENQCSQCFAPDGKAFATGAEEAGLFGFERCPASDVPAPHVPLFAGKTVCYCARCKIGLAA